MSSVTTLFDAVLDGTHQYHRPRLPCDFFGQDNDIGFSSIWYAEDILAVDQTNQTALYNYTTRVLTPTVGGNYTFTVDSAVDLWTNTGAGEPMHDTQIWLYDTTFDPANPLANVIAANEDIDYTNDETLEFGNWLSQLPNMTLTAGHTYVLVVTTYSADATGSANFSAVGPGALLLGELPDDSAAPLVGSVGVPAAGTYGPGTHLDFTVTFDETVLVETGGGIPALGLVIGNQPVRAGYVSGTGTATLTFRYTLVNGLDDGDGITVASLAMHGGTIRDMSANDADTTLHGVGNTSGVLVDTLGPTVLSIDVAQATVASISYTVTLSEEVTGVSAGDFTLAATGTAAGTIASVVAIDGKTWTVTVDNLSGDGSLRLDLNGTGTGIADLNGNAIAGGFTTGQAQPVDPTAPAVVSVAVPAAGTYGSGSQLEFTVSLSEAVTVDTTGGTPRLALDIGGQTVYATYASGSGTTALVFRHTLASGLTDGDGIAVGALSANGGTLKDAGGNNAALALNGVGNTAGVLVDSIAPAVLSVAVPAAGTYGAGAQLDLTVTLSEAVTVDTSGGTPRIALDIGGQTAYANYASGSGTSVLVFRHTLASGQIDNDGITVGNLLTNNGGTLKDAGGNNAILALNGVGSTSGVLVDSIAPTVVSVAVPAAGTYVAGSQLNFTVTLDEAVTVDAGGGTPRIALDIGGQLVYANYVGGSGTSALVFRHTLASGLADGDGITVGALSANGGTLRDAGGNHAALALNGVGNTAGVLVDSIAPTIVSVAVPAAGTYATGSQLEFTVTLDEAVTVDTSGGTPRVALVIGSQTVYANYVSGSGSTALVFRHTLTSGKSDADGITVGALSANGGTLKDAAGNNAALALNGVGSTASVLVDSIPPAISGNIGVPSAGTYRAGQTLTFNVVFDDNVTVTGSTSTLSLSIGGTARTATFVSSGPNSITYAYTVQAGDNDADGISIGALSAGTSTIRDAAGNDASLTLARHVPSTANILVDTRAPAVTGVTVPANGTHTAGTVLDFTVAFDENVAVSGAGHVLGLTIGGTARNATFLSSTANTITYRYTVQAGDNDADGIAVGAIGTGTGAIRDAAGNDAALSLTGRVPSTAGIVVDAQAPAVTGVAVPAGGISVAGQHLDFTVAFDEAVIVTGSDSALALTVGAAARNATFLSSSANTVTYRYTVQPGDNDADGIAVGALALGTSTIRDAAGNDAVLALAGHVPATGSIQVDAVAPAVAGPIGVPAGGTYHAGDTLVFTVTFDSDIVVQGTGSVLGLDIGGAVRGATLVTPPGTATLTYAYVVQEGDIDADGIAVTGLVLNGSTIRDAGGNDADVALAGHVPPLAGVQVDAPVGGPPDTQAPSVTGVAVPANDAYRAGEALSFTVAFDENVTVTGTGSTLALTIGGTVRAASFASSSGNTITYTYTVQAGDNDADGIAVGALALGTSTIRDAAGNDAVLALAGHVPPTAGIAVDTRAPAVSGVTVPPGGIAGAGQHLDFTVAFDEPILVTGTDGTLGLTIGGAARHATFLSSSANAITYRYTVQAGDSDADGIAVGAIGTGTGTIRDAAGNDATLSLAGHVPSTAGIVVDGRAASVTGVTVPQDGATGAGGHLDFTVAFDEAVTVAGSDGTLALTIGGVVRHATFLSSSANTITYRYTVQAGDNDADGIAVGAIDAGSGTIRDAAGNDAALSLAGHVPSTAGILVDTRVPAVSGVAVPQNGVHGAGAQLDFTIVFDEDVTVTGTDGTLGLTIGGTARTAVFLSGSGNAVTYRYIVQAGDSDADGIAIGAVGTGSGAIRDAAGNDAALSLAGHVPPLAGVLVDAPVAGPGDTQAPVVSGLAVPAAGTYRAGETLSFTITFDEAVTVAGTDSTLGLTIGGIARAAVFQSGSGATVTYQYTVQAGDNDADGIAVGAVAPGASTIRDAAGNDALLALAGHVPPTAGIIVDTQAPAVAGVTVPPGGVYGAGTHLDFTVVFDEAVTVSGSDGTLGLTIGATARNATFLSSSGNAVTYRYTVQAGDSDADGIAIGALSPGTGAIRDAAGNDAALSLEGRVPPLGVLVDAAVTGPGDTQAPAVANVAVPAAGTYRAGETLGFTIAFDENVTVTGTDSTLALVVGGAARTALFASAAGNLVTYTYAVQAGDNDADGITVGTVDPGTSTIRDAAGNDAVLALAGHVPPTAGIVVDTRAPAVTGVSVPPGGIYTAGAHLDFTVAFDEAVTVTGSGGTLELSIGGTPRSAAFLSASNNTVTYRYTVQSGDSDADGIAIGALALGTGAIRDAAGNDASVVLAGHVPPLGGVLVGGPADTEAPSVVNVGTSAPGIYAAGQELYFTVEFSEAVLVSGTDSTLGLTVGGDARAATFVSGSGNTIVYRYVVQPGDNDADGIAIGAIGTGTGTIRDAGGNDASLSLAGHLPPTAGIVIDTRAPAIAGNVLAPAAGTYTAGQQLDFTVTFDEAIAVTGSGSTLGLTIGSAARSAVLVASTANSLTYRYTVQAGDADGDGIALGAIHAGTGAIRDAAGNDATLALAGHVPATTGVLVDGNGPDTVAPAFAGATVNGRTLVLAYTDAGLLDAVHGPAAGAFLVTAGGTVVAISAVAVDAAARTVTLTLATAVRHDQPVTVAYADPTDGDDVAAIQDLAGNDAPMLAATPVLNTTPPVLTPPPDDPPAPGSATVDGVLVQTTTVTRGDGTVAQVVTVPVVTPGRVEQVGNKDMADIPLVKDAAGASLLIAQLPVGFGLQSSGTVRPASAEASLTDLIREIRAHTAEGSADQAQLTWAGNSFVEALGDTAALLVQTIVPTAAGNAAPGTLVLNGTAVAGNAPMALVIDARALPPGSTIELNDVDFAAVVGEVRIVNGAGAQVVWGDGAAQEITLGAGDDVLHGGAGNDIVGSAAGNDHVFGDEGDDIVFGGQDNDTIDGGTGNDIVRLLGGGRADYSLRVADGELVMTHRNGGIDGTDVVSNVETLRFTASDTSVAGTLARLVEALTGTPAGVATVDALARAVADGMSLSQVAHALYGQAGASAALDDAAFIGQLYRNVFDRAVDGDGLAYWAGQLARGAARADVALAIADAPEKLAMDVDLGFGATDVGTLVRLYSSLYDRAPDEAGLNYWIGVHESGVSIAAIADAFVADAESRTQYDGLDDAEFVATLYATALHRQAGAVEAQYWTGALAGGHVDRGDVLLAFADSAEKVALVGTMSTSFETL